VHRWKGSSHDPEPPAVRRFRRVQRMFRLLRLAALGIFLGVAIHVLAGV